MNVGNVGKRNGLPITDAISISKLALKLASKLEKLLIQREIIRLGPKYI